MTEAEWLACTDPKRMLNCLKGKASDRKLRLFACACCRRVWEWLGERSRHAIEVTERYSDGRASHEELRLATCGAAEDCMEEFGTHHPSNAASRATGVGDIDAYHAAVGAVAEVVEAVWSEATVSKSISLRGWPPAPDPSDDVVMACHEAGEAARRSEQAAQSYLLRDIFHGPLRPVHVRGRCRSAAVLSLARTAYEDRAFGLMPILGDALEEAGCGECDLLSHCRQPGDHARGCWVVDALLLKP